LALHRQARVFSRQEGPEGTDEKRFLSGIRKKIEKGEDDQPRPDDNQHGSDKRTSLRALNDAFLDKSSGKDP
jgi:hypothetical protein